MKHLLVVNIQCFLVISYLYKIKLKWKGKKKKKEHLLFTKLFFSKWRGRQNFSKFKKVFIVNPHIKRLNSLNNVWMNKKGWKRGVMKKAVKWTSTDVDRQPSGKEQSGRHRPRKEHCCQRRPSTVNVDQIKVFRPAFGCQQHPKMLMLFCIDLVPITTYKLR